MLPATCPFTALQSPHIVPGARLISQFIQSFQGVADLQYKVSSTSITSHRMSSTKQEQRATLTYLPAPFLLLAISLSLPPDRVRRQASPSAVARAPGSGKIPAFPPESETTRSMAQKAAKAAAVATATLKTREKGERTWRGEIEVADRPCWRSEPAPAATSSAPRSSPSGAAKWTVRSSEILLLEV